MPTAKRFSAQGWEPFEYDIAAEAGLALNVNGKAWVSLQCLPQDLEALAAGFLFNEGVIQSREEISLLQVCPDGSLVDIWLTHAAERPADWRITSGCGGGQSAASLEKQANLPAVPDCPPLSPAHLLDICDDFLARIQAQRIPGTHASGLYPLPGSSDQPGTISVDIGRHNTLDKLAGQCLLAGRPAAGSLLISSGRISSDMLQKAARMGTPWLVSLRSATSLALQLAGDWQITVITHARRGGFEVLTHPQRLNA